MLRPPYRAPKLKQDKIRKYFMQRAIQIGEAALLLADLEVPLFILARVLCEDTLWMLWVSRSRQNALKYTDTAASAEAKISKVLVKGGRIRLVKTDTRRDVTQEILPMLEALKDERTAWALAQDLGLCKLYDILYRWNSLYVHGYTFEIESQNPKQSSAIPLSHIQAFLWVIFHAADRQSGCLGSEEVLKWLGLSTIGGK